LQVLCGATGSAKTRVLHALAEQGAQVIDLEGYASHKGSLLGQLPGVEQPSQKHFETLLATQIGQFDLERPVFIEGESAKIGRISVPMALVEHMRQAPVIEVQASAQARLDYLLRDYAYLGADAGVLATKLGYLKDLQGKEVVGRWQGWAAQGELAPLFAELMDLHYDPHYERSQARNFAHWDSRQSLQTDDLSDARIGELAAQIRQLAV
jgi:tRNA 2-selenouridine synthase